MLRFKDRRFVTKFVLVLALVYSSTAKAPALTQAAGTTPPLAVQLLDQADVSAARTSVFLNANDIAPETVQEAAPGDEVSVNNAGEGLLSYSRFGDAVRLRIFRQGQVSITSTVELDPNASLGVIRLRGGPMFVSDSAENIINEKIRVVTGNAELIRKGTQFYVYYTETAELKVTFVQVLAGSVIVQSGGITKSVGASGRAYVIGDGKAGPQDNWDDSRSRNLPTLIQVLLPNGESSGAFAVLDAATTVQSIQKPCVSELTFVGKVQAVGAGTITYQWEDDQHRKSDVQTMTFVPNKENQQLSVQTTQTTWPIQENKSGWMRLVVLSQQVTDTGPEIGLRPLDNISSTVRAAGIVTNTSSYVLVSNPVRYRASYNKVCPQKTIPPPPKHPVRARIACPPTVIVSARVTAGRGVGVVYTWIINGRAVGTGRLRGTGTISRRVPSRATVRLVVRTSDSRAVSQRVFAASCR